MKKHAIIFASLALSCLVLSAPLSAGAVSSSQTEASSLYIITVQPELPVTERSELELTALEMTQTEKWLRKCFPKTPSGEKMAGCVLVILICLESSLAPFVLLFLAFKIHTAVGIVLGSFFCYQMLATKSLKDESMRVYEKLEQSRPVSVPAFRWTAAACGSGQGTGCKAVAYAVG